MLGQRVTWWSFPGDEEIESSESSSFPLPYPWGIHTKDPAKPSPKEKSKSYPLIAKGVSLMKSQVLLWSASKCSRRRRQNMRHSRNQTFLILNVESFSLKKKEPLVTPMIGLTPLQRARFTGSDALDA